MKQAVIFLAISLLLGAVAAPAQPPAQPTYARPSFPVPLRENLLNGLQMVIVERPTTDNVAINFTVRAGAMFDVIDKGGLASLTAELLLSGGTEGLPPRAIQQTIESAAPDFKVTTTWDATTITATTRTEDLPLVLNLIGNLVAAPRFDKEAFEQAKANRIAQLKQTAESAADVANHVLAAKLYPKYPLGHPPQGTAQSISNIDRGDIFSFYRRFYLANNSVLVVTGSASRDAVVASARAALGRLLKGQVVPTAFTPPAPPTQTAVYVIDRPGAGETYVALGHLGIARTHDDYFPALLLNHAVGGSPTSLLVKRLGEERNYTRVTSSRFEALRIPGPFVVTVLAPTASVGDAVAEGLRVLGEVRTQGLNPAALQAAKDYFINNYPQQFQTNAQLAERLAEIELYGIGRDYILNYQQRVAAVTPQHAHNTAAGLLRPDAMVIVAVGPAAQLKEALGKFGPVEVVVYDPHTIKTPAVKADPKPGPQQQKPGSSPDKP